MQDTPLDDSDSSQSRSNVIALCIVVGIVIVGLSLIFMLKKKGNVQHTQSTTSLTSTTSQTNAAPTDNIYMKKTDSVKGTYITDFQGMSLYTYDKDSDGVSVCLGSCLSAWPLYTSGATAQSIFPPHISVITRADKTKQFAWDGKPLYYFANDTKPGQISGDGVGGFHLAK